MAILNDAIAAFDAALQQAIQLIATRSAAGEVARLEGQLDQRIENVVGPRVTTAVTARVPVVLDEALADPNSTLRMTVTAAARDVVRSPENTAAIDAAIATRLGSPEFRALIDGWIGDAVQRLAQDLNTPTPPAG